MSPESPSPGATPCPQGPPTSQCHPMSPESPSPGVNPCPQGPPVPQCHPTSPSPGATPCPQGPQHPSATPCPQSPQVLVSLRVPREVDLVVEVAHPCVAQEHGEDILAHADFMLGSPTVLADPVVEQRLRGAAARGGHTLYVPRGALWGCEDIARMDRAGTLAALKVTMTKAPQSFRLEGWLQERLMAAGGTRTVLYEGPLRPLCPLAPNNVNTMAAAAVAAPHLGFDGVQACLVADPSVPDWHIVEVEVTSVGDKGRALSVTSIRRNPAAPGAVTGSATRHSFWSSLLGSQGHPPPTQGPCQAPPSHHHRQRGGRQGCTMNGSAWSSVLFTRSTMSCSDPASPRRLPTRSARGWHPMPTSTHTAASWAPATTTSTSSWLRCRAWSWRPFGGTNAGRWSVWRWVRSWDSSSTSPLTSRWVLWRCRYAVSTG
uniref:Aspartate dehydrogenase domain-containing protein n=1 Tax=Falco tinnunculus TaxID=100819 RepID=A0A8C4VC90_FALTI